MDQRGVVSLISVSIISLLVIIMTIATSALMVGEFRQSIDNESSVKAYYGAYSGLEETYALISAINALGLPLVSLQHDCASPSPSIQAFLPDRSGAAGDVGHTCRVIQAVSTEPKGTIALDKVLQYNLTFGVANPAKYMGAIELTWDGTGGAIPPPVIFTIVAYPKSKNAVPTDIRSVILKPSGGPNTATFSSRTASAGTIVTPTTCGGPPGARCHIRLNDLLGGLAAPRATYDTILRLRPYARGMDYSLKAFDESGAQMKVALPEFYADMTSRSGNTFRRLSSVVPVQSKPLSILDNVIFGNNSICKDFIVLTDNAGYEKIQVGPSPGGCRLDNSNQQ